MKRSTYRLAAVVVVAAGATLASLASRASPDALKLAERYDQARDAYEIGHYAQAFAAFAQLADEGHCVGARVAREMLRHGRSLYYTEFSVAPERLRRWEGRCPTTAVVAR